jgi:isopenicillin N synthase-like dioxygenase
MDADGAIPCIDIQSLFGGKADSRDAVDRAILAAATDSGFMTVSGLPASVPIDAGTRRDLPRIFSLPAQAVPRPQTPIYRGWFPLRDDADCCVEGIDIGPDVAYGPAVTDRTDALRERTPLPPDDALPGWAPTAGRYYRGMERAAELLMRGIARGLGLAEDIFDAASSGGISTLRLAHYPARGNRDANALSAHADLGLVTLLARDGIAGLQARSLWQASRSNRGVVVRFLPPVSSARSTSVTQCANTVRWRQPISSPSFTLVPGHSGRPAMRRPSAHLAKCSGRR